MFDQIVKSLNLLNKTDEQIAKSLDNLRQSKNYLKDGRGSLFDKANQMKEDILKIHEKLDIDVVPLTPVVGAHAGPGTLAVGYIELA